VTPADSHAAATAPTAAPAGSQSTAAAPLIYPAKGQSADTQQKDMQECSVWAKTTTGVDPVAIAQSATQQPAPASGGAPVAGGAAKGAAAGALIGAVAGDAGKGAAVGATTGVVAGGARARKQKEHQQAQAQDAAAKQQAAMSTYQRAYTACLEGRGYTVK